MSVAYDNDLFISYAHIDNKSIGERDGWVEMFHEALEVRLGELLGGAPRIWRDPKLNGNDVFAEELKARFTTVYLLVSVLSPGYIRSEWCLRELDEFVSAAEKTGGLNRDNKSRAFKVLKTPVPITEHPDSIKETLGYKFFELDRETGRAKEFRRIFGEEAELRFLQKLDDLAQDIALLLRASEEAAPEAETQTTKSVLEDDKPVVYLAPPSFDLSEEYDALRRDLIEHGHTVLPDGDLPLNAPDFETAVTFALSRAKVSLHLVGSYSGFRPDGGRASSVPWQHDLAQKRGEAGDFVRLVWIAPPSSHPEDEEQSAFIETLRTSADANRGADVVEGNLESVKTILHQRLDEIEQGVPGQGLDSRQALGPARVYLLHEAVDADAVVPVDDFLFDAGFEVVKPLTQGSTRDVLEDHRRNLETCDAVLVFYGKSPQSWIRQKWSEIQKAPGYGRQPIAVQCCYVTEPEAPEKTRYRSHQAMVVKRFQSFAPETLSEFVAAVRDHAEGKSS